MSGVRPLLVGIASCLLGVNGCAPAQPVPPPAPPHVVVAKPSPSAPPELGEEPEPALPELRTGRIAPVEHAEALLLSVRRHALDGDEQLLEIVLPQFAEEEPGDSFWLGTEARISGSSAPFQLVSRGKTAEMVLWLRRSKADLAAEIMGDAYTPALGARPGHHFRIKAPAPSGAASPQLAAEWATAAVAYLAQRAGVFGNAAAARLQARYHLPGELELGYRNFGGHEPELGRLFWRWSDRAELQAELAAHRSAVLAAGRQPRKLPLAQLKTPAAVAPKWAELGQRSAGAAEATQEPLAKAVPADFYFVRARSFAVFAELLASVEQLGAPVLDVIDDEANERGTLQRYLGELGLESSDSVRVLGADVVTELAVTGSDPYIHEGSDVTLVFRLKNPLLFRAALTRGLAAHGAAHGGTKSSSFKHEGVTVDVARSIDGRVRQHHAVMGDLELVSNSPVAIRRVISAIAGKAPRLADEPDFAYFLARDADVPAEVLGYMGWRFVQNVIGPAQKIAEVRRQIALSELTAPTNAALLYGWIHGKSPSSTRELVRSGLLAENELKHADGSRITWTPGTAPSSAWGTPAALEPLLDLPQVSKVSEAEEAGYAESANNYQLGRRGSFEPLCLRVSGARRGDAKWLHAEARVVPSLTAESAKRFDALGEGRVSPGELVAGARLSLGLGEEASARRDLSRSLRWLLSDGAEFQLDWLGDYAMVGVAERSEVVMASRLWRQTRNLSIERPASASELGREEALEQLNRLSGLPAYAVIGLRSKVAAALALAGLRQRVESTAPGAVQWAPFATYRGIQIERVVDQVRVRDVALYYCIAGDNLLVTFNRTVLRTLIDQALDGKLPLQGKAGARKQDGQAVFELSLSKKGALRTLVTWALSVAALEAAPKARAAAEAVLRGVPESAYKAQRSAELMLAYLGVSPLTPDGRRYFLAPEGIADPLRGTAHAPEWPGLPTAGSSAEQVLSALSRLRTDVSFDEEAGPEPKTRSLRTRVDLWLR